MTTVTHAKIGSWSFSSEYSICRFSALTLLTSLLMAFAARLLFVSILLRLCFSFTTSRSPHLGKESLARALVSRSPSFDQDKGDTLMRHLLPDPSCDVSQMSGTDLAYIGDCVYELFMRSRLVWPSLRTSDLNERVIQRVNGALWQRF